MPKSKNINSYADVRSVLERALAAGGGRYKLKTPGAAVHWRMRAYAFRRLLQEQEAARSTVPGFTPSTFCDNMTLKIDPNDPCAIIITTWEDSGSGELEVFDKRAQARVEGHMPSALSDDDPLLLEAIKLAGGDE